MPAPVTLMMAAAAVAAALTALWGLHRLALWMEWRGWIYYRKSPAGLAGPALQELQALTEPAVRHLQEAAQQEKAGDQEERESGAPKT